MTRDLPCGVPCESVCTVTYPETAEYLAMKALSIHELSRLCKEVAPFWRLARELAVVLEDGLLDEVRMHAAVLAAGQIKLRREGVDRSRVRGSDGTLRRS